MADQLSSDLASLRINRDAPSPPSAVRKLVLPLVVVAAVGTVGFFGWQRVQGQLFKTEVRTTEVAMISPSQADVQVTATGYVIPQVTSKVGSKLPGRLAKVLVKEGDTVKEGDVIAQLEDTDQRSALAATSSRVGVAKARSSTARAQLNELNLQIEREEALVKSGAVGKANLDDMKARQASLREAVSAAEAETTAAQADVGTVGVGLKDRIIVAPISGRVVTKPATPGSFVGGIGNPEPIAELVDFTSLMVEADVPEPRLHLVKMGSPCEIILDAYPNKRYRCEAASLGQRVNRSKATVMVKVKFDPNDDIEGVLPEMSARVSFLSQKITDAAKDEKPKKVVASDAIVERNGQKVVFAVAEGKLHAIPVKVGGAVGSSVELLDGPPQGTKVVSKPTGETADGQRIKETDK
ncbi:MAG: efflux RND transporter periplasmic adaptor subunit [Labilithrix sp.]|nr:efflux RND transporter periplasmic adaptor subunit [Labilithrix sp.]MCW5811306.1 efflux RND transporter periplasmic adaptor subunit [Labilithrix sp.]